MANNDENKPPIPWDDWRDRTRRERDERDRLAPGLGEKPPAPHRRRWRKPPPDLRIVDPPTDGGDA